ncbi:hypothetical protein [uncultured Cohaesibacter sp.]|uniref:hypothetical protein n=1 Tax=uncultured Cohaesibacter sp. TaxID=1002546 RepID=UPI00292FDE93|nr:hypothetical protein [uncultured Cohaesibacter sp.]
MEKVQDPKSITWSYDHKLLSWRLMKMILLPIVGVPLVMGVGITGYMAWEGEYDGLLAIFGMCGAISLFFAFCYLIVIFVTGNSLRVSYVLDEKGIFSVTVGAGKDGAAILGALLFAISDDMTSKGIGLLAQKSDALFMPWDKAYGSRRIFKDNEIRLYSKKGRMINYIRAPEDMLDDIERRIKSEIRALGHAQQG